MVGLRAKVLGQMGWTTSPYQRACALSCPSLVIYGPGLSGSGLYNAPGRAFRVPLLGAALRFAQRYEHPLFGIPGLSGWGEAFINGHVADAQTLGTTYSSARGRADSFPTWFRTRTSSLLAALLSPITAGAALRFVPPPHCAGPQAVRPCLSPVGRAQPILPCSAHRG